MRIGYDISQTGENKAGCGFFADQLIRAIANVDNQNQYILYPWFYDYKSPDYKKTTFISKKNFESRRIRDFDNINQDTIGNIDVIHSNNFRYPWNINAKKIVTIYDVGFLDYPEYTTEANRLICYRGTFDSMLNADKIISISNYSKERLLHFFPFTDEKKISVVYLGNRDTLTKEEDDKNVLRKYGIDENQYFLSVGTVEPRKNYRNLLKAYAEYKKASSSYKKLCIAGAFGWLEEDFMDEIKQLGLKEDVIVTGYVSERELSNLYRYCFSFAYISWYEGFGLPILEAMNFKKPVIASNVTSIPEVTLDKAILVNPQDINEIAEAMYQLEKSTQLFNHLSIDGYNRAKFFTWEKTAREVIEIYGDI